MGRTTTVDLNHHREHEPMPNTGTYGSKAIFGFNGVQIEAMQGGKLKGADEFNGSTSEDYVWDAHCRRQVERSKEQAAMREQTESAVLQTAAARDPRVAALLAGGVQATYILRAVKEIEDVGDDSLLIDLARIDNIELPKDQVHDHG